MLEILLEKYKNAKIDRTYYFGK